MGLAFAVSFQTVLPEKFQSDPAFRSLLILLRGLGFQGVELNISDPLECKPEIVTDFLSQFGLELSMYATGSTAKRFGLSLSHSEESVRKHSVEKCRQMIDWAAGARAGLIIGLLKGGVCQDPEGARVRLGRSLVEIAPTAAKHAVPILLEATNRRESSTANTLEETIGLLEGLDAGGFFVLPDTFHMSIEEADMFQSLERWHTRFISIHLSDDNRRFPGYGRVDFGRVIHVLKGVGYMGRFAIEGNALGAIETELRASMEHLTALLGTA